MNGRIYQTCEYEGGAGVCGGDSVMSCGSESLNMGRSRPYLDEGENCDPTVLCVEVERRLTLRDGRRVTRHIHACMISPWDAKHRKADKGIEARNRLAVSSAKPEESAKEALKRNG